MTPYYESKYGVLYQGDCLEVLPKLDKKVDLVLTDPPYGTTACKWDIVIPFDKMWEQLKRIISTKSAICLFGNEPFTSMLICSNIFDFKYRVDWDKKNSVRYVLCEMATYVTDRRYLCIL